MFRVSQLREQTGCSLVQAHTSPSHTDWSWVLAEAYLYQNSSVCVVFSLVTLTVISLE